MAGILRNIELYTLSFKLAKRYIDDLEVHAERSEIGLKLHEAIRREISSGLADPVNIAENALRSVREAYRRKQTEETA